MLTGLVTDPFGVPRPDATVELVSFSGSRLQTLTDKNGQYIFKKVPTGDYDLNVSCEWCRTMHQPLLVSIGTTVFYHAVVVSEYPDTPFPAQSIVGEVTNEHRGPISEVRVTILSPFGPSLVGSDITDPHGHFRIVIDHPGQYVVCAYKPELSTQCDNLLSVTREKHMSFELRPLESAVPELLHR